MPCYFKPFSISGTFFWNISVLKEYYAHASVGLLFCRQFIVDLSFILWIAGTVPCNSRLALNCNLLSIDQNRWQQVWQQLRTLRRVFWDSLCPPGQNQSPVSSKLQLSTGSKALSPRNQDWQRRPWSYWVITQTQVTLLAWGCEGGVTALVT